MPGTGRKQPKNVVLSSKVYFQNAQNPEARAGLKEDDGVDSEPGGGFLLRPQPGPTTTGVEDDGEHAGRRPASQAGPALRARARRPRGHRSREARVEGGKAEEAAGQHSLGGRVANSVPAIASLPTSLVTAWLIRSFSKHSSFGSCQEETHNTAENFRQSFPNIFF